MAFNARPYILEEANYKQLLDTRPNVAVLPWGATEAHNYHLPYGTDKLEATKLGEMAVAKSVELGGKVVMLPCVPFGNNCQQLNQIACVSMRTSTQYAILHDVAESLVRQGIDRLVILNFHGGNEFRQMMRDIMLDLPIFILQIHGWHTAKYDDLLDAAAGYHADEFETSCILHINEGWVDMAAADDGPMCEFKLKAAASTPGVGMVLDWQVLTKSSGAGNPHAATPAKGKAIFERFAEKIAPVLAELSQAKKGDFPYVVRPGGGSVYSPTWQYNKEADA
jgi:creatinine amidohydrolase